MFVQKTCTYRGYIWRVFYGTMGAKKKAGGFRVAVTFTSFDERMFSHEVFECGDPHEKCART